MDMTCISSIVAALLGGGTLGYKIGRGQLHLFEKVSCHKKQNGRSITAKITQGVFRKKTYCHLKRGTICTLDDTPCDIKT